jgi:hypothetical protein
VDDRQLLEVAMNVECQTIRVPTGVQDYRPALYGGVAAVELGTGGIERVQLDVDPAELTRRIVLAYTGAPRNSGTNNWDITKRHIDGDRHIFDCFERIRDTAVAMRAALERGDWDEVGRQIATEWDNRRRLAPGVSTAAIDDLIARAAAAGATAAKVCGAGGGGCLFCYGPPHARDRIVAALTLGRRPRARLSHRDGRLAIWRPRVKLRMLTTDDKVAEIKRLYYATTAKTIQADLARALDLLKSMNGEDERERAAVYMDGLAQMRADWNRSGKRQKRNGKRQA